MTEQQEVQLQHYLKQLWQGKWLVLFCTVVAVIGVLAFSEFRSEAKPSFSAIVTVSVEPVSSPVALGNGDSDPPADRDINTQIRIMGSRNVIQRAVAKLDPDLAEHSPGVMATEVAQLQQEVTVRPVADTNLLEVRVQASTPEEARAKADAVVEAYIEYVKDERVRSIEDALAQVDLGLQETQQARNLNNQLAVLLPSMGSELSSIAQSVEGSRQIMGDLRQQQDSGIAGTPLDWEVPQIQETATTLSSTSQDLQQLRERLSGDSPGANPEDGSGDPSLQTSHLEEVADELDVITQRLRTIQSGLESLDPLRALEAATARAQDANSALTQVPGELQQVQTHGEKGISEEFHEVSTYAQLVSGDLQDLIPQMQEAKTSGDAPTQNEMVVLRGQVLAHASGLQATVDQVQELRKRPEMTPQDISRLSTAEEYLNSAARDLQQMAIDLEGTAGVESLQGDIATVVIWIEESSGNLRVVHKNFLKPATEGENSQSQHISPEASYQLEEISLTLQAAEQQLRSLESQVTDPLTSTRLNSATERLASAKTEVETTLAQLGVARLGQFATFPEGLRSVQERVQDGADVLATTLDNADPEGNPASEVHADVARVANSLAIATRQLQELARTNNDPLVRGELEVISDRLSEAQNAVQELSDRLSQIVTGGIGNGGVSRTIDVLETRLQAVVNALEVGADIADEDLRGSEGPQIQDAAAKVTQQADIASSILSLVVQDLEEVQQTEVAPMRYGQLGVLAERIQKAEEQATTVADQLNQIQQGRGSGYFELQQVRADLELALLQPQETGITRVDAAVAPTEASGRTSFLAQSQIPLGGVAGFLLGSMAVLLKAQMDTRVTSQSQLRDRAGLATLGVVPKGRVARRSVLPLISARHSSAFSEAMQLLGLSLSRDLSNGTRSFLITSGTPGEGKTTVTVNLARVLANCGHRTLLVDGNLRRPRVAQALNLVHDEGLATALAQGEDPEDYIIEVDGYWVLPAGQWAANPVELLSSAAMTSFLQKAQNNYDVVLVDCPPTLGFAETKAIAKGVSGAVVVVKAGVATVDSVQQCVEALESEQTAVVGGVLNFAPNQECSYLYHEKYNANSTKRGYRSGR